MGRLTRWLRPGAQPGTQRRGTDEDIAHLRAFARSRSGVEAFVEPRTTVTDTTVLLVADDGEWTRRRVHDARTAASFARDEALPLYDPAVVGYPARMREYNRRHKAADS